MLAPVWIDRALHVPDIITVPIRHAIEEFVLVLERIAVDLDAKAGSIW